MLPISDFRCDLGAKYKSLSIVANFENAISALSALGYVGWVALGDGISLMNRGRIGGHYVPDLNTLTLALQLTAH